MDARAARETDIILRQGAGDRALLVNCNGEGPLSAEWMLPKALWLKTHEPETWARAKTVCEFQVNNTKAQITYLASSVTSKMLCYKLPVQRKRWEQFFLRTPRYRASFH